MTIDEIKCRRGQNRQIFFVINSFKHVTSWWHFCCSVHHCPIG